MKSIKINVTKLSLLLDLTHSWTGFCSTSTLFQITLTVLGLVVFDKLLSISTSFFLPLLFFSVFSCLLSPLPSLFLFQVLPLGILPFLTTYCCIFWIFFFLSFPMIFFKVIHMDIHVPYLFSFLDMLKEEKSSSYIYLAAQTKPLYPRILPYGKNT